MEVIIGNLTKLGYRELEELNKLIKAYINNNIEEQTKRDWLNHAGSVNWGFNTSSGNVFLTDEDNNSYMLNDEQIELWLYCPNCRNEDYLSNWKRNKKDELVCKECKEVV